MIVGPFLGLFYITIVPLFTIITFVLTGGFYAIRRFEIKRTVSVKPVVPR
jgi:hypothetical protein